MQHVAMSGNVRLRTDCFNRLVLLFPEWGRKNRDDGQSRKMRKPAVGGNLVHSAQVVYIVGNQLENHSGLSKITQVEGVLWDDKAKEKNVLLCSLFVNISGGEGSRTGV